VKATAALPRAVVWRRSWRRSDFLAPSRFSAGALLEQFIPTQLITKLVSDHQFGD
jgi:hypothetical protein